MSLAKVWFLACKKGVFAGQKVGFCIAKVWFLFFECCVVAICSQCYRNLFAMFWQSVSNILAIRSQCFGNPSAAVGVQFIASVSTNTPKLYYVFMPLALQFASFRHIKTIWVGLKNGHDESAPMPYVLFVAIHLRNKWILRNVLCHIFCTINKWYGVCVGVFIDVHLRCLLCE